MIPTPRLDVAECALRIVSRPGRGAWTVILSDCGREVAAKLLAEWGALQKPRPRSVSWAGLGETIRKLREPGDDGVVVSGLGALSDEDWRALDLARSELQRDGPVVLVTTPEGASAIGRSAPHLMSWIGADVWAVDLQEEDRRDAAAWEQRLVELRREHDMTDEEVVRRAIDGTLPSEPEFAEWLALVGRGDLLASR